MVVIRLSNDDFLRIGTPLQGFLAKVSPHNFAQATSEILMASERKDSDQDEDEDPWGKPLHSQRKVLTKTWNDEHKKFDKTATKKSKVKWKNTIASSPFPEGKPTSDPKHKSKKPMQTCIRHPKYKTQPKPREIVEEPKLQD